ncbi:winged helix DNA-binding domain-containing protein [Streptomyces sp. NBC_01445]|uniref:winged helix DNA-binding domain-containing protein n=1 Tax=Streptomyces sp. NBC_01445 TaxID=2903869 RepID=UPI002DD9986C|nr:winged helix DNA-binding domain-containing protein [Streptomyces sp. NBC_01445]WSE04370.1 winged helix DNA-binding domain-containing protein [Streptomyces sp. NBC_01445]
MTTKRSTAKASVSNAAAPTLSARALGRATLDRQFLLRRSPVTVKAAVEHLLGLQAQNVKPPYGALAARLDGFDPAELSRLLEDREVVRIVTMRSTIHLHSADDCMSLRPLVQPARERELKMFAKGLPDVDLDRLTALTKAYVEQEPRTPKQIRELLLAEWPDADPLALTIAARCRLPLVQTTPRGLWKRSGQVALTTAEHWLDRAADPAPAPDGTVLRYLAAFGPASVKDMQQWAGLTRMREVFERLRPQLVTFRDPHGVELFDLPDAPRPDEDTPAPPRLLPEFDNLLLSHADRTRLVPLAYKDRTWKANMSFPAFLVDGMLAGLWKLDEANDDSATLTLQPFGKLTAQQRDALTDEAETTARTLGVKGPCDIRFGTVRPE